MLNAPSADLESQKRSLLCSKHSAWLMDPNNQHSVQWLLNVLWKQGLVMYALPQTCLRLTGLLRHEHTDWLPGMWQRLKKLCLIHQSLISEPQIRQTNMILNVRIVYWIRIRSSQWLTSRIHGHHHMLCFLPKAALLGLCCRRIQSLHVCESFSFVFNNWNARSAGLKSGDWLCRWKSLDFFASRHSTLVFLLYALGHYRFTQWSTVPSVLQYLSEQSL